MPVVLPVNARGLVKEGVPADPPADAPGDEYALTVQRIVNLISTPELFFQLNPAFDVLRETTDRALKTLLDAGIIAYAGQTPQRKGGCGGCARRKLLAFALQFASRFQMIVLRAQADEQIKLKLANDLRAYLQRKDPNEPAPGAPIVLYARGKQCHVTKVTL